MKTLVTLIMMTFAFTTVALAENEIPTDSQNQDNVLVQKAKKKKKKKKGKKGKKKRRHTSAFVPATPADQTPAAIPANP